MGEAGDGRAVLCPVTPASLPGSPRREPRGGSPTRTASGAHVALWSRPVVFLLRNAGSVFSTHFQGLFFILVSDLAGILYP